MISQYYLKTQKKYITKPLYKLFTELFLPIFFNFLFQAFFSFFFFSYQLGGDVIVLFLLIEIVTDGSKIYSVSKLGV